MMASQGLTLTIDPQGLRDVIDGLLSGNRIVRMTTQYGETVPISKAARMLNRSRTTVYSIHYEQEDSCFGPLSVLQANAG